MTEKKDWFINLDESKKSIVKFADDSKLVSQGIGKVMIKSCFVKEKKHILKFFLGILNYIHRHSYSLLIIIFID